MVRIIILAILCLCFTTMIKAQHDHASSPEHDHEHHHHHKNEIGIATAPVYFLKEETFSFGLHLHYLRAIGQSGFGLGVGYERIFDEHGHNTFGLMVSYRPADKLTLILSPGVTIEDAEPDHRSFALHMEAAYEFAMGDFHLGPLIELAYDPEDIHLSLGLHIGIGF